MKNEDRNSEAVKLAKKLCHYRCVICGWPQGQYLDDNIEGLIDGAHIKEFSSDKDADVTKNIIALCPNHHRLFDRNYFYISQDFKVVYYDQKNEMNGIELEIEYVEKKYLRSKQSTVEEYWEKQKNS